MGQRQSGVGWLGQTHNNPQCWTTTIGRPQTMNHRREKREERREVREERETEIKKRAVHEYKMIFFLRSNYSYSEMLFIIAYCS